MAKKKLLAIVGSLRRESWNLQLAQQAQKCLGNQADLEILQYGDVPFFNQDLEFPAPEAVKRVRAAVKAADGIWFFSPEYNHYFPGVLKNLLDWLSRPLSETTPQVLAGKPAAVSGITVGTSGTVVAQDHLVSLISFLNMRVMNAPRLLIPTAQRQTDAQGRLSLTDSAPFLQEQAAAFLRFVERESENAAN